MHIKKTQKDVVVLAYMIRENYIVGTNAWGALEGGRVLRFSETDRVIFKLRYSNRAVNQLSCKVCVKVCVCCNLKAITYTAVLQDALQAIIFSGTKECISSAKIPEVPCFFR